MASLSYFADFKLFGPNPRGWHAVNIVLHLLTAICVFLLIGEFGAGLPAAFAGGLVFLVHPLQTEAVVLASNREELLCGLFFFLSFLFYLRGGGARYTASVFFFILAMFSKEMAASLPIALAACDAYRAKPGESFFNAVKNNFIKYIPYLLVVAAFLALRYTVFANPEGKAPWIGGGPFDTLLTMSAVFFNYIRLLVVPVRQCADYVIPALGLSDPKAIVSLAGVAGFLIIAVFLRGRSKYIGFAMAFFFISFLPVSNIIPFGATMADRYMYIPAFAACLAVAAFVDRPLPDFMKYVPAALAVLALATFTSMRIGVWKSDISLWGDTTKCAPQSAKAYLNLGNAYLRVNSYGKALDCYNKIPKLKGEIETSKYQYNLGLALFKTGNEEKSRSAMENAAAAGIKFPEPYFYLSMFAARRGNIQAAEEMLDKAVAADPLRADSRYIAGRFLTEHYTSKDKLDKATALLGEAAKIDPSSAIYPAALGEALLKAGNYRASEKALRESIRRDGKFTVAYILLVKLYNAEGRNDKAAKAWKSLEDMMRKGNK